MELIDSHAHLSYEPLNGDIENVIARSEAAGVTGWITVGTTPEENGKAIKLAGRFANMYAAVGIHPHEAKMVDDDVIRQLKLDAANKKVVAIGETGLDYHYTLSPKQQQREAFYRQLNLAVELSLPVVIHSREAFDETLAILTEFEGRIKNVVFHCFSGTKEQLEMILDKGWFASFTGVVTFKNASALHEAVGFAPVDKMMIETDCPYLSPEPMRKQKINEPALLIHTAEKIAFLKGLSTEEFARNVTATTRNFFNI